MLPTITTSTGGKEPEGKTGRKLLHLLSTPTMRDYKDSPGMATNRKDGKSRNDQLPRQIYAGASTAPIGGMKLTPEFLCWLQGFPQNWLKPLRDALAIPSVLKSPKPSQGQSVKD